MPVRLTNLALDCADAARIVGLGAGQQAEYDRDGYHWHPLTDPEGNEFDVIARETETATTDQEG